MTAAVTGAPSRQDRIFGCLLGGALGDALGAPIEFLSLEAIRDRHGPEGLRDLVPAYGRIGAFTDDTQMTLFTAEGVIRAVQRGGERGICAPDAVLLHAYLRWLHTQGEGPRQMPSDAAPGGGWLIREGLMHERRAPGNTCLSSLRAAAGEEFRAYGPASNDSKGCGGVMRMAPVGFFDGSPGCDPFELGCEFAALTHGHATGQLSAGAFALMIHHLAEGADMEAAARAALGRLASEADHAEITAALEAALAAALDRAAHAPSAEIVESLGRGWIAEEALAIGVYCALVAQNFEHGVRLAVNHGGDSDSTGSIAGNLLGARWGVSALPAAWLAKLEGREIIERLARDLGACHEGGRELDAAAYPPW